MSNSVYKDELLEWLQDWAYANYKKCPPIEAPRIRVTTIDNPGWGFSADVENFSCHKNLPLANALEDESNWYYCTIKENRFEGDGGLLNLPDIFAVFKGLITGESFMKLGKGREMVADNLKWLMQWYQSQCDGDWEHGCGIHLGTIDNPGWSLSINLEDTELETKPFLEYDIEKSENDWIVCFIKNRKFEGRSGPGNLIEMLAIFREWAES